MSLAVERIKRKAKRIVYRKTASLRSAMRAGIVGCGSIAPDHATAYDNSSLAHLVAVSDVRPQSLSNILDRWSFVKGYKDLREMFQKERLDVVSVCTWPQIHAEIVRAAASAGVHGILCEKPLALQLSQVEEMIAVCAGYNCKLAGGHQYRFHSLFAQVAHLIRGGQLGMLKGAKANIASSIANNGPHLIDTIRFVFGDAKVVSVECTCDRSRDEWNRGMPVETSSIGALTFEGGLKCHIETGDRSINFFSISVEGSKGSIEVSPNSLKVNGQEDDTPINDCWQAQFDEFLGWVKGKKATYAADAASSAETVHVLMALYESARLGRAVQLPLTNKGDIIQQLYPVQPPKSTQPAIELAKSHEVTAEANRLASEGGIRAVRRWFSTDPAIGLSEWIGLTQVVLSKRLNSVDGHMVKELEKEAAAVYGGKHAVASTSGTAAIHVAVSAINPEPGDEIITSPVTDMGSVIPILMANCIPVFSDIDPDTGNITAASIEKKITPRTKAVILVHLFGHPAEIAPIQELLRSRGIALIEDCCQAHYATYRGEKVGTFGDFGCFSLQQSKQITCGDGGITLVNREDLVERATLFVDKGWDRKAGRTHLFLGMNYRMTELQGAVARAQFQKLPMLVQQRHKTASLLNEKLREIGPFIRTRTVDESRRPAWWTYPFSIDEELSGISKEEFYQELTAEGVRVVREYVPTGVFSHVVLTEQRTYGKSRYPFSSVPYIPPTINDFPGFQEFRKNLMLLTWSHNVTVEHVESIARAFQKVTMALKPVALKTLRMEGHSEERHLPHNRGNGRSFVLDETQR